MHPPSRPSRTIQYKEASKHEFGDLRVVHLGDVTSIETQLTIKDSEVIYGMRLSWRWGPPPLRGELISLHLPQSKNLVRVSRVTRTCVCCAHGITQVHVEPVNGVLSDMTVCECSKKRQMRNGGNQEWRDIGEEVSCTRRKRGVLRRVSDMIEAGRAK